VEVYITVDDEVVRGRIWVQKANFEIFRKFFAYHNSALSFAFPNRLNGFVFGVIIDLYHRPIADCVQILVTKRVDWVSYCGVERFEFGVEYRQRQVEWFLADAKAKQNYLHRRQHKLEHENGQISHKSGKVFRC
jgi:hypothetical protein